MRFPGTTLLARAVPAGIAVTAVMFTVVGCSSAEDAKESDTPKANVGECIAFDSGAAAGFQSVDCGAETAYEVVQRIDGEVDELSCDSGAQQFLLVEDPKTTYCLIRPQG